MDEQQIRHLVRQAIARHLGPPPGVPEAPSPVAAPEGHPSFVRFHLERPATETECLIEPTVACNHCGYCQCYGH